MHATHRRREGRAYAGLEHDLFIPSGDREALSNTILLARILGMICQEETCAGWSTAVLSHLREAVWYRYDRAPKLVRETMQRELQKARFQFLKKRRLAIGA